MHIHCSYTKQKESIVVYETNAENRSQQILIGKLVEVKSLAYQIELAIARQHRWRSLNY